MALLPPSDRTCHGAGRLARTVTPRQGYSVHLQVTEGHGAVEMGETARALRIEQIPGKIRHLLPGASFIGEAGKNNQGAQRALWRQACGFQNADFGGLGGGWILENGAEKVRPSPCGDGQTQKGQDSQYSWQAHSIDPSI